MLTNNLNLRVCLTSFLNRGENRTRDNNGRTEKWKNIGNPKWQKNRIILEEWRYGRTEEGPIFFRWNPIFWKYMPFYWNISVTPDRTNFNAASYSWIHKILPSFQSTQYSSVFMSYLQDSSILPVCHYSVFLWVRFSPEMLRKGMPVLQYAHLVMTLLC